LTSVPALGETKSDVLFVQREIITSPRSAFSNLQSKWHYLEGRGGRPQTAPPSRTTKRSGPPGGKAEVFLEEGGGDGKCAAVDIVEKDGEREKGNDAGHFRRELCGDSLAQMRWADCSRSVLLEVEDEEGNVVLLWATRVVTGKTGDFVEKGVGEGAAGTSRCDSRNSLHRDLPNSSCAVFLASKTPSV
jgi:hypothetical protein